jgi:hypothetical protein
MFEVFIPFIAILSLIKINNKEVKNSRIKRGLYYKYKTKSIKRI